MRTIAKLLAVVSVSALAAATSVVGVGLPTTAFAVGPTPIPMVPLGSAASFAVLTLATVGNTASGPVTTLRGDLGAGAGTTGFPPGVVTGTLYTGAAANPALADLTIAYDNAKNRPAGLDLPGDLLGESAGPGVHTNSGAVANTGTFTIDADGDPDAVFIFQIGGALSMAAGSHVVLTGQAKASNVFWVVTGAGAVGAGATFAGTLMASTAIGVGANTIFNGRALAQTGAITVNSNEFYSAAPTVSIDGEANAYTTDTSPTITGITSVRSPSTVTVTVHGETLVATPAGDGTWWATPVGLLGNAIYTVTASVVDGAANTGTFSQQLTVDTEPPAVEIDGGLSIVTNHMPPTLTGSTDVAPGQTVTITMARITPALTLSRSTLVQSDGTWNITPNGFTAGAWTVSATVTDPAGNQSSDSQAITIDLTAPAASIDGGPNALTNDTTPILSGTSETGAVVTVSVDGVTLTGVSAGGGVWSVTYAAAPLGYGVHNVAMTATDPAENVASLTQSLTVDNIAPSIAIDGGAAEATNDRTPTISGNTNVAAGVTVNIAIGTAPAMTALVQSNSTWNATPSALLDPGTYSLVASVADMAGNIGTYSQSLVIDITNPTVTIVGGPSRSTADATPTITGSSLDVAIGAAVTVTVAGQTLSTTIAAGGSFSVTAAAMTNGAKNVFVSVTDAAGNSGSNNQSLTIIAVLPTVTIDGGPVASTNDATPRISGSSDAVAGSTVVVTVAGQTLHATVQPGGSWNVTAAHLDNSVVVVGVSVTDPDGNVGVSSQNLTVDSTTVDTVAPVVVPPPSTTPPAEFTSVGPKRVFDTRQGQSANALRTVAKLQVSGAYELQLQMTDLALYVPASGVGAVSLNVTSTGSAADGFITVYSCGTRQLVSSVNFSGGETVANAVVAPVSTTGAVCFYSNTPTDIIVDINGWFPLGAAFTSVGPSRVFDTRLGNSPEAMRTVPKVRIAADGMLEVSVTDLAGQVPATGVDSVSLNVTVTNPEAAGFITVYPCGTRAFVSSVNFVAGQTVANAVLARLSPSGTVCFYSSAATDLVVDINGWVEAGSAVNVIDPVRVVDTRPGNSPDALREVAKTKIGGGHVLEVQVTDLAGRVPAGGVTAVSLNVTVTNPDGDGFVTVYACGALEEVSSVNYGAAQTVANAVLAPVSATGTICLFSNVTTDVIVDINGWIGIAQAG